MTALLAVAGLGGVRTRVASRTIEVLIIRFGMAESDEHEGEHDLSLEKA